MAELYAGILATGSAGTTRNRGAITSAQTIEGNKVIWNCSAAAAGYNVTVRQYDKTRVNEYDQDVLVQPVMIIKCSADTSANNVGILTSDGAGGSTTLYTFAADYSVTPRYIALRLSATRGADGSYLWELA